MGRLPIRERKTVKGSVGLRAGRERGPWAPASNARTFLSASPPPTAALPAHLASGSAAVAQRQRARGASGPPVASSRPTSANGIAANARVEELLLASPQAQLRPRGGLPLRATSLSPLLSQRSPAVFAWLRVRASASVCVCAVSESAPTPTSGAKPARCLPTHATSRPAVRDPPTGMYAIEVPDGAKPGDPIKVRLPDGVTVVKITVPEGAGPGTTLEFELPSEEGAPAPEKPKEDKPKAQEPQAVAARLHSEEKVKMSDGVSDLTNTAPERIYVITLPEGVVPGKPIVAEIEGADGATVLVPVPRGAKAGRELLFRVQGGLEDDAPKVKVYRKGSLKKISPKSNLAMTIWQTRWFELTDESLMYWDVSRPDGVEKKGVIPVHEL
eukprot:185097-Prymnesium_polylepis.1